MYSSQQVIIYYLPVVSTKIYKTTSVLQYYMSVTQNRSKRKKSGGRYTTKDPKKVSQSASSPAYTEIGEQQIKVKRTRGGHTKHALLKTKTVNLYDQENDKHVEAEILNVVENPANTNYVRRNIITKGCIIDTTEGKAKVTNRPGQEKTVQAIKQ